MKKFEKVLVALVGLSLILHYLSASGAALTGIIGLGALSLFYFFFGIAVLNDLKVKDIFKSKGKIGIGNKQKMLGLYVAYMLAATCMAILFKLSQWPGASDMANISYFGLPLSIILVYLFKRKEPEFNTSPYYTRILAYAAFLAFLIIVMK